MNHDVLVLGAGMIGVSVAVHLARRGRSVLLVDRREPGRETSFGNAGIIQREGIRPHLFPRDLATILRIARNRSTDARYALSALPSFAPRLWAYRRNSAPERYERIVAEYAPLIARSLEAHADLIAASGSQDLIQKAGYFLAFRSEAALAAERAQAERARENYGIAFETLDSAALARAEPALLRKMAGAIHWTMPWTVRDPGALVSNYAALFSELGGKSAVADARTLVQDGSRWSLETPDGTQTAREVVVALGPWAPQVLRPLGYRLPLFVKRGYHMHYGDQDGHLLNHWMIDAEVGYLLAPMRAGLRLTTGAEFAHHGAPPSPIQIDRAERAARSLLPLGARRDAEPWTGARPCTPDMKPIIGPAPGHDGLWLAVGHAHHGFTLGPATGDILGAMMAGEDPGLDMTPFAATRFARSGPRLR